MATLARLSVSRLLLKRPASRVFSTTTRAMVDHSQTWQQHGVPGSTLPFSINNRYKLTAYFMIYFGVAFNLPFIVVAHQLIKHSG